VVKELVDNLLQVLRLRLSNTFLPVLQEAIGVGSAFEGWSPCEPDDVIYHLLLPLKPPSGHRFCLEPLGSRWQMPAKDFRIRVELECSCGGENMLCFLHHTEDQMPHLLDILCTNSYLDAAKLTRWFQDLVKKAWETLRQARHYQMKVLPHSQSSCLLQVTGDSGSTFILEIVFGVQQGASDIFLTTQTAGDTDAPSTRWTESYIVAEVKFFSHMAKQVPCGRFHLKCLHLCTSILEGTDFSPYIIKTIVMYLLNTTPVTGWCRRNCIVRLADIMRHLHCCLRNKTLNFFFFGNAKMPKEIILPPEFQTYEPYNLLQHLVQNPAAHTEALRQFEEIQEE
ncbi:IPIL1 protein, partial [Indicator maculatus]|nr:IPIL1 protein [Indicator maculatus]